MLAAAAVAERPRPHRAQMQRDLQAQISQIRAAIDSQIHQAEDEAVGSWERAPPAQEAPSADLAEYAGSEAGSEELAAVRMQARTRGKHSREQLERKQRSAVAMQARHRGKRDRRKVEERFGERPHSAASIDPPAEPADVPFESYAPAPAPAEHAYSAPAYAPASPKYSDRGSMEAAGGLVAVEGEEAGLEGDDESIDSDYDFDQATPPPPARAPSYPLARAYPPSPTTPPLFARAGVLRRPRRGAALRPAQAGQGLRPRAAARRRGRARVGGARLVSQFLLVSQVVGAFALAIRGTDPPSTWRRCATSSCTPQRSSATTMVSRAACRSATAASCCSTRSSPLRRWWASTPSS